MVRCPWQVLPQGRSEPAHFKASEHVRRHRWCEGRCLLSCPCHRWCKVLVQCASVEVVADVDPVDDRVPRLVHLWCGLLPCGVDGWECGEDPLVLVPRSCCHCRLLDWGRWLGHLFCRRCSYRCFRLWRRWLRHLLRQAVVHYRWRSYITEVVPRCCWAQCAFRGRWARRCLCRWLFLSARWAHGRRLGHQRGQWLLCALWRGDICARCLWRGDRRAGGRGEMGLEEPCRLRCWPIPLEWSCRR